MAEPKNELDPLSDPVHPKSAEKQSDLLVSNLGQALRLAERNRAQMEAVLQAISDGIVIFDMSGNVVLVNEAEARINGFESAAAMKRDVAYFAQVYEIFHLDGTPVPVEEWPALRVMRGESFVDLELRGKRKDTAQEWFFSFGGAPVFDEEGKQVLAVVVTSDVTERKQMEVERDRLLSAELEARERAEGAIRARDEFLSVAAHELKTPVTSLRGYAQVLLRRLEKGVRLDPAGLKRALSQIDRQSERLSILVNQLLDLSRIDAGKLALSRQDADVTTLVRRIVDTFRRMHGRHHFVYDAPKNIMAWVDPLRIDQAVTNLLDNAVKFSPAGSPVSVSVSLDSGVLVIAVRDHGIGIGEEQRERIFDRFYQAHQSEWHGGLGLGLYVTRQIAELHGGTIAMEAAEGGGTRFVVRIPADEDGGTGKVSQ